MKMFKIGKLYSIEKKNLNKNMFLKVIHRFVFNSNSNNGYSIKKLARDFVESKHWQYEATKTDEFLARKSTLQEKYKTTYDILAKDCYYSESQKESYLKDFVKRDLEDKINSHYEKYKLVLVELEEKFNKKPLLPNNNKEIIINKIPEVENNINIINNNSDIVAKVFQETSSNIGVFKDIQSSIQVYQNLIEQKGEIKKKTIEDLMNLISSSNDPSLRDLFLKKLNSKYPKIENLSDFKAVLEKLDVNCESTTKNFSDYLLSSDPKIREIIESSLTASTEHIFSFPNTAVYENIMFKMSEYLLSLDNIISKTEINLFIKFSEKNELLTLAMFEPYLITILGTKPFLEAIIPLHENKVFSCWFKAVASDYRTRLYSDHSYSKILEYNYKEWKPYVYNAITVTSTVMLSPLAISFFRTFFETSKFKAIKNEPVIEKSNLATSLVKGTVLGGEGLENNYMQAVVTQANKFAFSVGNLCGSTTRSFIQGIAHNYEDAILKTADYCDEKITERKLALIQKEKKEHQKNSFKTNKKCAI